MSQPVMFSNGLDDSEAVAEHLPIPVPHNERAGYTDSFEHCISTHLTGPCQYDVYLSVKLVPRLGPLAVSSRSKKVTASAGVKKVTDKRPP